VRKVVVDILEQDERKEYQFADPKAVPPFITTLFARPEILQVTVLEPIAEDELRAFLGKIFTPAPATTSWKVVGVRVNPLFQ
jgi:hypothetical protein